MYLFATNRGSAGNYSGKLKIHYTKIWDNNDNMIANFIPVRSSGGVLGMYDLVDTNPATAFHTNAGSGTFTAGPNAQ